MGRRSDVEREEAAVAAARRRVAKSTGNRSAKARLVSGLTNLADALRLSGDPARARVAASEALVLSRALFRATPTDPRLWDVGAALAQLVMIERELGDFVRSDAYAAEAVEVRREMCERSGHDVNSRHLLAMALARHARTLAKLRKTDDEIAVRREQTEVLRTLASEPPADDELRDDLCVALCDLADELSNAGRHAEAVETVTESVPIRRRILAAQPDDPDAWNGLARSLALLRDELAATDDSSGALAAAREVVACGRRQLEFPGGHEFRRELAVDLDELGDLLVAAGDRDGAAAAYAEAEGRFRALHAAAPDDVQAQHDLSIVLSLRARLLFDGGDPAAAAPLWTESVALRRALVVAQPERPVRRRWLAGGLHDTGQVREALGDREGAAAAFEEAATLLASLRGAIDGLDDEIRAWCDDAADAASACGRPDEAQRLRALGTSSDAP